MIGDDMILKKLSLCESEKKVDLEMSCFFMIFVDFQEFWRAKGLKNDKNKQVKERLGILQKDKFSTTYLRQYIARFAF